MQMRILPNPPHGMQKQLVVYGMTNTHEGRSKSHQTRHNASIRSFGGSGLSHPHECTSDSLQTRPTASSRSFGKWKSSYKLMRIQIHTNPPYGIHCGVLQMVSIIQIKGNLKPTPPSPRRAVVCFELVLTHPTRTMGRRIRRRRHIRCKGRKRRGQRRKVEQGGGNRGHHTYHFPMTQ